MFLCMEAKKNRRTKEITLKEVSVHEMMTKTEFKNLGKVFDIIS